ncbi:MAG TPA: glycosyltransferase [Acidobacteriaceae bacterium]|nr:glycosyltransferase [Acidobacteriaceae bacterium]
MAVAGSSPAPRPVNGMYRTRSSTARPLQIKPEVARKVLLVHNSYRQQGGEDQVVNAEAELLRSYGHEVRLYHANNADIRHGLSVVGQVVWNQQSYRELRALIQRERPEVVHVHNTFPIISPSALYAAAEEALPVVHTLHNYRLLCPGATFYRDGEVCEDCVRRQSLLPAVIHGCYRQSRLTTAAAVMGLTAHRVAHSWQRHVAAYIALTEFARSKFVESGFDPRKLHVKPNFIGRDPGVGSGSGGYALFVGRLTEEKGVATLINAWKELGSEFRLEIVGEGPLSPLVQAAQESMPNVRWHGWVPKSEVLSLMQGASMLIMPSEWYEGFPVTLVEAFATGLPAVVSRIGSLALLVEEGRTGLHFEAGNPSEVASTVRYLFSVPEVRESMRWAARREYEKKYTAEANYAMLSQVYSSALNQQNETSGPRRPSGPPITSGSAKKKTVVFSALRSK